MNPEHLIATEIAIFAAAVLAAGLLMWAVDVYYNRWNRRWRAGWATGLQHWENQLEVWEHNLEAREAAVEVTEAELRRRTHQAAAVAEDAIEQINDDTVLTQMDLAEFERMLHGES